MRQIIFRERLPWKESSNHYTGRVILVALEPGAVCVRLKKKRAIYRIPIDHVFRIGAALAARQLVHERKEARKTRRKGQS